MSGNLHRVVSRSEMEWRMPIDPENYNRSPLNEDECWALEYISTRDTKLGLDKASRTARELLARFNQPLVDVFDLRHQDQSVSYNDRRERVQLIMHRAMHRYGKMYWDWSPGEWMDILCPNTHLFAAKYGNSVKAIRMTIMDAAYLLGGVTDLRSVGIQGEISQTANTYFGSDLMMKQCMRILDALKGKGYKDGKENIIKIRYALSTLCVLQRSPYLEDISEDLLIEMISEGYFLRQTTARVTLGLQHLGILSPRMEEVANIPEPLNSEGMAREWYEWCLAWYERTVDLSLRQRRQYALHILAVGRWMYENVPEVRTPEQWTEDLALRFRSDLSSWVVGQYVERSARCVLETKGRLGKPLKARGIIPYLIAMRRFLSDLTSRPYSINGESAHKLRLDFSPKEVLTIPSHIKREADEVNPRDIDLRVWAKLTIAAATLSQSDLPKYTRYSLSFHRAMGLLWVTSARRPNEILRLRLDCLREDWDQDMLDEDDEPVIRINENDQNAQDGAEKEPPKIYYLYVPTGKKRGPFWIWIPHYTANEINNWKCERPMGQRKLLDRKTHEDVDFLFCYRDTKVGQKFLNECLIPILCTKAGVDIEDAKGRITGHRGRSTRLTLLRKNGLSLEDLAEYAGHGDTKTIRHYIGQQPIQLQRRIRKADDVSRIIEGVVDLQAAAKGQPALRWFIGYDANGEPMFCGNQLFITCPHRLDCERCGMFIGGEKAKLLEEGENTLPIEAKVPMTPIEKCVVDGDQEGAEACRAALRKVPAPEVPDVSLIFNPEGLSNHELEKLAQLASADALDKLRQALDAHEKRLAEVQKNKTGRNALVGAQKKRISLIQKLIADCEQTMGGLQSGQA